MAKLTIVRGIPGSGKSTWAKQHCQCMLVENDMFLYENGKYIWTPERQQRAIDLCFTITADLLAKGIDVVVCNTFTKRSYITKYIALAKESNAEVEVIKVIGRPEWKNIHNVPANVYENMKKSFEDWPGEIVIDNNRC